MTPWRLQCSTGLRIIRDTVRIDDTLVIAGQRKGMWGDPILEWQEETLPTGPPLYEYDLTAGAGGAATPIATVEGDEVNCLAVVGDEVWAGGCAQRYGQDWYGRGDLHLDGAGALWVRDAVGDWAAVELWGQGTEVDTIVQIVAWREALWLRTRRQVWRRASDGTLTLVTPAGARPLSLYTVQGALCLLTASSSNNTVLLRMWQRGSSGWQETGSWSSQGGLAWPNTTAYAPYHPRAIRALGEPHVGANEDRPQRDQGEIANGAECYWPWELTHERVIESGRYTWVPRNRALSQQEATFRGHIYRLAMGGSLEGRVTKALVPETGLAFAWSRAINHGERLFIPECVYRLGERNANLTVWPWADDRRLIPGIPEDVLPSAYESYSAVYRYRDSEGLPHYTTTSIDALATTYHVTAMRRSAGRLYAGIVDRLWQDVVPFERLYPWPQFLAAVQKEIGDTSALFTRTHLPFTHPDKLWDPARWEGMVPPSGDWAWAIGGGTAALPPPDFPDFWNLDLTAGGFDWGALPEWPSYLIPTDDNRANLYQVSRFAFKRLIAHGTRYLAASGTDGWVFAWYPAGRLVELFDVGAPIRDMASFGGKVYIAAGSTVEETEGLAGTETSLEPSAGCVPHALLEYGSELYAVCPGASTTEVWTCDGTDWTLLATLPAVLTCATLHGTALWLGGAGANLWVIDSSNPTGASVAAGAWGGTEAVTALHSLDGYLVAGTDGGRTAWTNTSPPTPLVWTETAPGDAGYPVPEGASVTALGDYDGDLWLGLTTSDGIVEDLLQVALPAGASYWAVGDEGNRSVYQWPTPWSSGVCASVAVSYDAEAITRVAMESPTPGAGAPKFWFSGLHCARNPVVAMSSTSWGGIIGATDFVEADQNYWWALYSAILAGYEQEGIDLETFAERVADQDAACGRDSGAIAPGPLMAGFVMARLAEAEPDASVEIWVTTRVDSFDLTDYQILADGQAARLLEPSPYVRFALRFLDGDATAGIAAFVGTEV